MIHRRTVLVRSVGAVTAAGPGLPSPDDGPPPGRLDRVPVPESIRPRDLRRAPQLTRLALFAAAEAVRDLSPDHRAEAGLFVALTHSSTALLAEFHRLLADHGPRGASPNAFSQGVTGAPQGAISRMLGVMAGGLTVVGHEGCGLEALSLAADALTGGRYPRALVGGAEEASPLLDRVYRGCLAPADSPPPHLPHPADPDQRPRSVPLSEGAAFVVVEPRADGERHLGLCRYTPLDGVGDLAAPPDLVLCGASGGPGDRAELDALRTLDAPTAFGAPLWGETFAASGPLLLALAIDILIGRRQAPRYPVHPSLSPRDPPPRPRAILLMIGDRDGRLSLGLVHRPRSSFRVCGGPERRTAASRLLDVPQVHRRRRSLPSAPRSRRYPKTNVRCRGLVEANR